MVDVVGMLSKALSMLSTALCYPLAFMCRRVASGTTYDINGKDYRMSGLLGEGGFSFVYLVTGNSGQTFAMKKILAQTKELLDGGLQEIKMLQTFRHRNVMRLVDSVVRDVPNRDGVKDILILLPIYRRGTFQDVLQKMESGEELQKTFYTEMAALEVFRGVCDGLMQFHDHAAGALAHNDLKPANVLIADDGAPVLMDFGSVRAARRTISTRREALELQEFASINCTPPYRAPELFDPPSQCEIDERVDMWSAGCLLYALLCGRSPFEAAPGQMGGSVAMAAMSGKVDFEKRERQGQGTMSVEMRELISSMIELDPKIRVSVHEAAKRCQELIGGGGVGRDDVRIDMSPRNFGA